LSPYPFSLSRGGTPLAVHVSAGELSADLQGKASAGRMVSGVQRKGVGERTRRYLQTIKNSVSFD
ncbi:MAG: hypothetical protein AB2404_11610, partial [Planifilum fimeticola]